MTSTSDRARLISFVAASGARRAMSRIGNLFAGGLPLDGRAPTRLLIAPHDLRTTDPTIAADIYRGRFSLSGTAVEIGAVSPFALDPPSAGWQEELLGFSWLRHFHAAEEPISRVNARALIGDWIEVQGRGHPVGWKPEVVARRIISWLAHSQAYLTQAEPDFYRLVMRSLGRQLRYLARHVSSAPDGVPRLTVLIAMTYATLCISGLERLQLRAARMLAEELDRQVLPDGGHISRDPGAILSLLLELLPLRQTFLSRDIAPPQSLLGAIDRMMPMVRFFRLGDGSFALFNGMGRTQVEVVSAILAYDDSLGRVPDQAPHSGYQRIEAGNSIILIDVGVPPPTSFSHRAHAGCLSFEMSSGSRRIISNCGSGLLLKDEWRQAARATVAHSTMVVGGVSSARYLSGGPLTRFLGTPIFSGPRDVAVERVDNADELVVESRHDGYRRLGIIHHRRIAISPDGNHVEGQDRLTRSSTLFSRTRRFSLRFHLHPSVRASVSQDSRSALLALPDGESWRLSIFGSSMRLEESVSLVDPKGVRRTEQIVISGQCGNEALIRWTMRREGSEPLPRVRALREGEREEGVLPLADNPFNQDDPTLPGEADSEALAQDAQDKRASGQSDAGQVVQPDASGGVTDQDDEGPGDAGQSKAGESANPDAAPDAVADPKSRLPGGAPLGARYSSMILPKSTSEPPVRSAPVASTKTEATPGNAPEAVPESRPFRSLATPTALPGFGDERPAPPPEARKEPSLGEPPAAKGEAGDETGRRIEPKLETGSDSGTDDAQSVPSLPDEESAESGPDSAPNSGEDLPKKDNGESGKDDGRN